MDVMASSADSTSSRRTRSTTTRWAIRRACSSSSDLYSSTCVASRLLPWILPNASRAQMPDEEAFCVLVRLMKAYDLRSHYTPNMPGLQLRLFQFDRLVEELLPSVFLHLLRQGVKSSMYASQWFLTLFGCVAGDPDPSSLSRERWADGRRKRRVHAQLSFPPRTRLLRLRPRLRRRSRSRLPLRHRPPQA